MKILPTLDALCSSCGRLLNANGDCPACLARIGLDEPEEEAIVPPNSFVFGDFEIERRADGSFWELGRGAMGVTYRAVDKVLHRAVALKVIEVQSTQDNARAVRERFLREARAAAGLRHPNVAGVFQFGATLDIGRCYCAMELVEGETLEARVRRDGPLKAELALEISIQVARALTAAAAQGLIHRDLKPANIMLTANHAEPEGCEAKVIDFGLAKSTLDGAGERDLTRGGFVGTPTFASPEQLGGAPVDARSDIYSLGVTLWYTLTGEVPYPGKTIEEIRCSQEAAALSIHQLTSRNTPKCLIALLRRTLAIEAEQRPASSRELLAALESCRAQLVAPNQRASYRSWAVLIVLTVLLAGTAFVYRMSQSKAAPRFEKSVASLAPISPAQATTSEKSIAVLPLENLSDDQENAFFADGLQDDILTSLARITDLKVISRTSVMQYRGIGAARNLLEIANALGVENILEGSVRRSGNRVVVNVQLIDTHSDRHLWAEHYDRTLADSIGLQGELATQIAGALQARLAPEDRTRLESRPTNNPEAYALYLKALGREGSVNHSKEDLSAADQLYAQAIALDPKFALAHARRSIVNSRLAFDPSDHEMMAKARAAAEEALRLSPGLGEGHMALGLNSYWAEKDYPAALKEFSLAASTSPNEPMIYQYIAGIYRRQGRWRESITSYQRAQEVDPRNREIAISAAIEDMLVRNWPAATAGYNRALEIAPDSAIAQMSLAYLEVFRNDNPAAGRAILQKIPADVDPDGRITEARWDMAMLARNFAEAEKILTDFPGGQEAEFPHAPGWQKSYFLGQTALARGDLPAAQRFFLATVPDMESWVRNHPDDVDARGTLGLCYAYMGRKADAIREARRSVEMEPESQDAFHGAVRLANLALVYALTGEAETAIPLIERLLVTPGPVQLPDFASDMTIAELRLRWGWDLLRKDSRFQKILSEPEPKTIY